MNGDYCSLHNLLRFYYKITFNQLKIITIFKINFLYTTNKSSFFIKYYINTTKKRKGFLYQWLSIFPFLTLSNPIFLPTAYSPALIYCGRERGWWITCWLKSVLHEEKCRTGSYSGAGEQTQKKSVGQAPTAERANKRTKKKCRTSPDIGAEWENHNVGRGPT